MSVPSRAIFGCSGLKLEDTEKAFFEEANPLGFIIFARNVESPDQLEYLTQELRDCVSRDALVLIDQEGGRVQRLRAPHWREAPAARKLGDLFQTDREAGARALWLNYRLIAAELMNIGIDCNCVPCLDVPVPGAHHIIGDRAFSDRSDLVSLCGRIAWQGLAAGGVLPVGKHIPGHGRALSDSHSDLPRVQAPLEDLMKTDFKPFKDLSDIPFGMTAHIVFEALDKTTPVTQSATALSYIRRDIGFDGFLMTDDLSMKALGGRYEDRAALCLSAGCDAVLHCNGDMSQMQDVMKSVAPLEGESLRRWQTGLTHRKSALSGYGDDFDAESALSELNSLLAG